MVGKEPWKLIYYKSDCGVGQPYFDNVCFQIMFIKLCSFIP